MCVFMVQAIHTRNTYTSFLTKTHAYIHTQKKKYLGVHGPVGHDGDEVVLVRALCSMDVYISTLSEKG